MERAAIISVYDKSGVSEFANFLKNRGYTIISTGSTAKVLKENGVDVVEVENYTGVKEMLSGRVKTLHPKIHGGILFKREDREHLKTVEEMGIFNIEVVVVNLYPFEQVAVKTDREDELIENIDIGGPTLLRAAAKNYKDVLVICEPEDYRWVMENFDNIDRETRKRFALKVFAKTSYYDGLIAEKLSNGSNFKEMGIPVKTKMNLRYGENPHQKAFFGYSPLFKGISNMEQLNGKELSYNNILDIDVAYRMILEFEKITCVIIKHNTPCGVATRNNGTDAYIKALEGDPISAFGGIIGINTIVNKELAQLITERFYEVVIAFGYEKEALEVLKTKKNLRVLKVPEADLRFTEIRTVLGGYLIQESDYESDFTYETVSKRKPTEEQIRELEFAFKVAKYAKSNAVVYAKDRAVVAIGAGQTSRIDSVKFAAIKAKELGRDLKGSVLASDGFFPFRDSIDFAKEVGVEAIVEPGGSIRDKEVIEAADEHGIALIFTHTRHFRH